jgi:hypothetical protein
MFQNTHTRQSPWIIIKRNNKKEARIESMRNVLSQTNYTDKNIAENSFNCNPDILQVYRKNKGDDS